MWNFKLLRHCATVPNLFITIATIIFTATMIYSQKFVFRGTRGYIYFTDYFDAITAR